MSLTDEQKAEKRRRALNSARLAIDPLLKERTIKQKALEREEFQKEYQRKRRKNPLTSDKTAKRTSRMSPEERERIRGLLIKYYGSSVVDKALIGSANMKEVNDTLRTLKSRMEKELEAAEIDIQKYNEQIDREYRKVGRPNSVFSWKECKMLCSIGCTRQEIAGFFGVNAETLSHKINVEFGMSWNEFYENQSQGLKISLRRAQVKKALQGDVQMLKFLGKNILGQKEQVDFAGEVKVNSWVDLMKTLEEETGALPLDAIEAEVVQ